MLILKKKTDCHLLLRPIPKQSESVLNRSENTDTFLI